MPNLSRLLAPRSVAIVGASPTPGALGHSVLKNLDRHRFSGEIYLINPNRDEIAGRSCLRSIADLPHGVDAAVLAIPGPAVLDAVRSLAARNVGAAVIFSAGFAEGGDEGLAAQAEMALLAADSGMIIEGPNCLGMVNYADGIPLTFVETPVLDLAGRPAVGIVSQSGAMAVVLGTTLMAKDLGITLSVSTGNEAASGVEDYVDYLIGDSSTAVIGMIVEQFRKPARFLELADRARRAGKTIILLHPGTSSAARESAATHTGAMAGDWELMRVKVERAGVVLVDSLEALGDVLDLAARAKPLAKGGVAVLTESGAFKALTLDLAEQIGLDLPAMAGETAQRMRDAVPRFIPVSNPMDLTAQALVDPDLYRRTLAPLIADERYAATVLGIIQTDPATSARKFPPIIDALTALSPQKPVIFAGLDDGANVPADYIAGLRALGVPYFPSPDRAFRALRILSRRAERDFARTASQPITLDIPCGVVPEYRAKAILAEAGMPFPKSGVAVSLNDAKRIAAEVGYPVVLKAQSAKLSHKSDAGGVLLNIACDQQLETAWERLWQNVSSYDPSIAFDGALVEAMGNRGVELILGARNDAEWGPVILVGFGGVTAELLHDVRLLPDDLTREAILGVLRTLTQAPLLYGYRGSPALDVGAVADVVEVLGRVLRGNPSIREIDLNPLVVHQNAVVALDALIIAD